MKSIHKRNSTFFKNRGMLQVADITPVSMIFASTIPDVIAPSPLSRPNQLPYPTPTKKFLNLLHLFPPFVGGLFKKDPQYQYLFPLHSLIRA